MGNVFQSNVVHLSPARMLTGLYMFSIHWALINMTYKFPLRVGESKYLLAPSVLCYPLIRARDQCIVKPRKNAIYGEVLEDIIYNNIEQLVKFYCVAVINC